MPPERYPPPGVPVISFPSPKVADRLHVERHDHARAWFGPRQTYQEVPAYGTAHPDTTNYADFRLVLVRKSEDVKEVGHWFDWTYVNDRASQDDYNYEILYREGDTDYPVYQRTYLIRRDAYTAQEPGTADPVVADLVQVGGDKLTRIGTDYLDTLYVVVTRTFEKVPGLELSTPQWLSSGVQGVIKTQQPVLTADAGDPQDADVVRQQLEAIDNIHAKQVTVTGATWENSAGSSVSEGTWGIPTSVSEEVVGIEQAQEFVPGLTTLSMTAQPDGAGRIKVRVEEVNWGTGLAYSYVNDRGDVVTGAVTKVDPDDALPSDTLLKIKIQRKPETVDRSEQVVESVASYTTLVDYKRLPGNRLEKTSRDIVAAGTLPSGAAGTVEEFVRGISATKAERVRKIITDINGSALNSADTGYTIYRKDPIRKVDINTTFKIVDRGTALPAVGSTYLTGYAGESQVTTIDGSDSVILAVEWTTVPSPRAEYRTIGYQFPAVLRYTSLEIDPEDNPAPPYAGNGIDPNTYKFIPHRNIRRPAKVIYSYHYGQSAALPPAYRVVSPNGGSKYWPRANNCVHPASIVVHTVQGTVEDIPASIPPDYFPNQVLLVSVQEREWKAGIWERETVLVSENLDPTQFGIHYVAQAFKATTAADILVQPNKQGEYLYIKSTNAETLAVTVFGWRNGKFKKKQVSITGSAVTSTSTQKFDRVVHVKVHSSHLGTVTVRGTGTGAYGTAEFTAVPASGDTLVFGKNGSARTYTYRSPGHGTITCVGKTAFVDNSGATMDYVDLTLNPGVSVIHRFAFDRAGTGANAPADPGTLNVIDISGATTATDVGVLLQTEINSLTSLFVATDNLGTVTVTAIPLGSFSITETVVNASFTVSTTTGGTAVAANQIRTTYTATGAGAGASDVAGYTDRTVNLDGVSGTEYSSSTTIHADMTSTVDADNSALLRFDDKTNALASVVWDGVSTTGGNITGTTIVVSEDGPLIATLPTGTNHAYKDVILYNPDLIDGNTGGTVDLEVNVPASVNLTSDSIHSPVASGAKLQLAASDAPALPVSYEVSQDNSNWSAGAVTLPSIGNGQVYEISLTESNLAYIRVKVNNSAGTVGRSVHVSLMWSTL